MNDGFLKYLHEEDVILNLKARSKKNIISILLDRLIETGKVEKDNKKSILRAIVQREEMGSTAIGGYIALPHVRLDSVKNIVICVAISPNGVAFDSLDDEPVNIIVLLLSNQKEAGMHLKTLAYLAKILKDKFFVQQLKNSRDEQQVISLMAKQYNMLK